MCIPGVKHTGGQTEQEEQDTGNDRHPSPSHLNSRLENTATAPTRMAPMYRPA